MGIKLTGYDGAEYTIGDRIELHPGTDQWMMGAKYGVVIGTSITELDRIKIKLDNYDKTFYTTEDNVRRILYDRHTTPGLRNSES